MIRYKDNDIILTGETSIDFINRVLHPSIEQSLLSENYQAMINGMTITHLLNGFSVEIPDLLIPE